MIHRYGQWVRRERSIGCLDTGTPPFVGTVPRTHGLSPMNALANAFRHPAAPGLTLVAAAALAVIMANTAAATFYAQLLDTPIRFQIGDFALYKPALLWINDGLMAIFFLLVGLEVKHELRHGQLKEPSARVLPLAAAIGGMAVPALFYVAVNWGNPETLRGWAIPAATDIAFALCVLSLLGSRAPTSLKVLLTAIAVIDDLAAIVVIALFYTAELKFAALGLAGGCLVVLIAFNRLGVRSLVPYLAVGVILWVAVLKSGVHATLAGVAVGLCIPAGDGGHDTPLHRLEHGLAPYVSFAILPIFGFANAGVSFEGAGVATLAAPVSLGVILGLVVGKPVGVLSAIAIATKGLGASLPDGLRWPHIIGMAFLTGIGFTMSLFIGGLAFDTAARHDEVRIGVMAASLIAAALGAITIARVAKPRFAPPEKHDYDEGLLPG